MNTFRFYVIRLKRNFFSFCFLGFTICLILFSNSNMVATKSGLKLWVNSVIPSLFPFFIATELLANTNIPYLFGKLFNKIMKPIFNVSGEGSFAFLMGIISGYPVGAKIAVNFRENNICSKEECERLIAFTNNSGPLFILGTVGINLFGSSQIGLLLLISHLLGAISVGICFRFWKKNHFTKKLYSLHPNDNKLQLINLSNLGENLSKAISSATSTILMIGGFIVLFSVINSILKQTGIINLILIFCTPICNKLNIPAEFASNFFTGIIELTNGINTISQIKIKQISLNIIITSFLLGFGGISIMLQVLSIISKSDLSFKPYIIGKILHAIFSAIYTYVLIILIPIFNFNIY